MAKKIKIPTKIDKTENDEKVDRWVNSTKRNEKIKRLTIDIPENLHKKIKITCANNDMKMADAIRILLQKEFN